MLKNDKKPVILTSSNTKQSKLKQDKVTEIILQRYWCKGQKNKYIFYYPSNLILLFLLDAPFSHKEVLSFQYRKWKDSHFVNQLPLYDP